MREISQAPNVLVIICILTISHFADRLLAQTGTVNEERSSRWDSTNDFKISDGSGTDEVDKDIHKNGMIAREQLNEVDESKRNSIAGYGLEGRRKFSGKKANRPDKWKKITLQFDQDNDGKLSDSELRNARKWIKNRTLEADKLKRKVVMKFDSNGDGKISRGEWREVQSLVRDYERKSRENLVGRYDSNGDGKLSRKEKQSAHDSEKLEMLKKYDLCGDGQLSTKERKGAFADMLEHEPIRLLIQLRRQSLSYGSRAINPP